MSGRLGVHALHPAGDDGLAGVVDARVQVGDHADAQPGERPRPARERERVAADDEPARLDPAGVGGEPHRAERERRARGRPGRAPADHAVTSSRRGMPSRAPAARVESAAAATANAAASRKRAPLRQRGGERAVERVAGARRVDGVHARRGQHGGLAVLEQQHAARAERHEHGGAGARGERPRGGLGLALAGQLARPRRRWA